MQVCEARIVHQLLNIEAADRLKTTKHLLHYLTAGIPDCDTETFFIACMNPKRGPIFRTHIRTAPLVACRISTAEIFLPLLLSEAKTFACLRTQQVGPVRPSLADGRLLYNLRETGRMIGIHLVDYLITRLDASEVFSWRENDHHRN
jgi:DNA repair protein RadC